MTSMSSRLRPLVSGIKLGRRRHIRAKSLAIVTRENVQREYSHASDVDGAEHEEDLVLQRGQNLGRHLRYDEVCSQIMMSI